MRFLLVNPNRFSSPPVPPIGLEILAGELISAGHRISFLDLCFSPDTAHQIREAAASEKPDAACITIRNVDSVIFQNHESYLGGIRDIITELRNVGVPRIIAGGAGIATDPQGVAQFVGADIALVGHAEGAAPLIAEAMLLDITAPAVLDMRGRPPIRCRRSISLTDYPSYMRHGAVAGFETHKGCSSSCVYCMEANKPVFFRDASDVVREIAALAGRGISTFHLCDSEFNEDLDQSLSFLEQLISSGPGGIRWALYMKPGNFNQKLFRLLKKSGAELITLTVDSFRKCPLYWQDTEKMVFSAASTGIRLAIDFLTGFPFETESEVRECFDLFRRIRPERVNVNTYIRLYKPLAITRLIMEHPEERARIIGDPSGSLLEPVFYNRIAPDDLAAYAGSDPIFRIEGSEGGVNYSRIGL